ncbi:MAG: DUF4345 domain-containing protein [Ginsengibacter sp.]
MVIALQILLGLVNLICILGGMNLLTKGANAYLTEPIPTQRKLDNLFRFMSGIYFSLGFLVAYVIYNLRYQQGLIYFIGLVVVFSGLGRLYSKTKVGSAGKYFDNIMIVELTLGVAIIVLQYLR